MPWRTICGFEPTTERVTLMVPNGAWRPDTVITDKEGTEMFVLLDKVDDMRSYEAIFGDLDGHRLCCVRRHLIKAPWKDGFYFCTYRPNYPGQIPLKERDIDNKKVYPFSYVQISPMKGRFFYRIFQNPDVAESLLSKPKMVAQNPWLGFMVVCCTPMIRGGKWTAEYNKTGSDSGGGMFRKPTVFVDQWRNVVEVAPGNDLLAGLCMAYVFDKMQCQPLVTVFGEQDDEYDELSLASDGEDEYLDDNGNGVQMENMPPGAKQQQQRQRHGDDDDDDDSDDEEEEDDDDDDDDVKQGGQTQEQAPPAKEKKKGWFGGGKKKDKNQVAESQGVPAETNEIV